MLSLGPCRSSTGAVSDWFFRSPYDSLEVSFKRQGASVIRQGKLGTCLFVIASGEVTILIDGVLWLVQHTPSGTAYAIKSVKKTHGQVPKELACECELLVANDHPFIMQLVKTFETA